MDSNQSGAVGGSIWVHFRVHWPIWGPLDGSKAKFRPFWGRFWPSLTPHANSVKSLWSQMACTGVPHIVLHILCSTRTCWGHFRPSKVSYFGRFGPIRRTIWNIGKLGYLFRPLWADFFKLHIQTPHSKSSNLAETELLIFFVEKKLSWWPKCWWIF